MILFTLDINFFKKQAISYFGISSIVCIFGYTYELFSHDVKSNYMRFAFIIPLLLGCVFSLYIYIFKLKKFQNRLFINFYNASIATFTIYSIIKGVLDIYGTTNNLINVYLIIGTILFIKSVTILIKLKKFTG